MSEYKEQLSRLAVLLKETAEHLPVTQAAQAQLDSGKIKCAEFLVLKGPFEQATQNLRAVLHEIMISEIPLTFEALADAIHEDWEDSDGIYEPLTELEADAFDGFHEAVEEGARFFVIYEDRFAQNYSTGMLMGNDPHQALDQLNSNYNKVLVLLDTQKSFEDQWTIPNSDGAIRPPGSVMALIQLIKNPVISIPEDVREHPQLKALVNKPQYIRGVINGNSSLNNGPV